MWTGAHGAANSQISALQCLGLETLVDNGFFSNGVGIRAVAAQPDHDFVRSLLRLAGLGRAGVNKDINGYVGVDCVGGDLVVGDVDQAVVLQGQVPIDVKFKGLNVTEFDWKSLAHNLGVGESVHIVGLVARRSSRVLPSYVERRSGKLGRVGLVAIQVDLRCA